MNQPPVAPHRRSGRAPVRRGLLAVVALLALVGLSLGAGAQPAEAAEVRTPVSFTGDAAPEGQFEEAVGATAPVSRARSAARPPGRCPATPATGQAPAPGRALPPAPRPPAVLRCVVLRC
ncbi:hypothetical protein [Streptomyces tsukubensis]|uniref:Uncharacterized protein n=1 Tax=Streptomyces tsukubensis (strain DSM 42081 / NBRC 108919 / NRRL 18488 / 9993) TaxID=1114943 RepID=A0A7G3UBC5_STRT9|nr:hypothetical protein [Streptomyces tsukubensis]AZK97438.1 hypothetical protein B7R87_28795 [Streptomyces tsukubensis]QKM66609.1 hypothetical protein STSU_004985 [Streptomyces tsukubensis NRRL18488]